MNRSHSKLTPWMLAFCLVLMAAVSPALATAQASSSSSAAPAKPAAPANPSAVAPAASSPSGTATPATKGGMPSASEIAAAKASGKVWVNTETHVYHKNGRWYGKTKAGKFMNEADAKTAGYKEGKR